MTTGSLATAKVSRQWSPGAVIDCDVHNEIKSRDDLKPYLARRWHEAYDNVAVLPSGQTGLVVGARPHRDIFRRDAVPAEGPPGSDLGLLREQHLDRYNVARALLHPVLVVLRNPTYGILGREVISALNRWMQAEWLEQDDRLFGAVSVTVEDGQGAADEIRRTADCDRFVKVMMTIQTREGLGHPRYWPMYEAAAERDMPIAAHVGGFSGTHMAAGWPVYWIESHVSYPQVYAAQVMSLVCSGVFDRIPNLRFVLEEGGVAWVPALMWRADHSWRTMRAGVAHLQEPPSQIIRRHFAFTTQPLDEPEKPEYLREVLAQLDMMDSIFFASDYPHWDFDDPSRVLTSRQVDDHTRERILFHNADRFFPFP